MGHVVEENEEPHVVESVQRIREEGVVVFDEQPDYYLKEQGVCDIYPSLEVVGLGMILDMLF